MSFFGFGTNSLGVLNSNYAAENVVCRDSYVDLFKSKAYTGTTSTSSLTLDSNALIGHVNITLTSVNNFDVGELIYIDSKSDNFEMAIIESINAVDKILTLESPLTKNHDSGVYVGQAWHNSTHVFGSGDPNTAGFYGRWLASQIDFDPGSTIVVIGDSWCEPGAGNSHDDLLTNPRADFNEFRTSITDRFPSTTVHHIPGGSGDDMSEQLDRWSQVVALSPSTVVHMSGFMNDLAGARLTEDILTDCSTMFNNCLNLGSYFIMAGVAPYSDDPTRASALKTSVENYVNSLT